MLLNWGGDKLISVWPTAGLAQSTGLRRAGEKGSESRTGQERGGSHETLVVTSMAVRASRRLQHSRERSLPTLDTLDICLDTLLAPQRILISVRVRVQRGLHCWGSAALSKAWDGHGSAAAPAAAAATEKLVFHRLWGWWGDLWGGGGHGRFRVFGLSVKVVTWWWICIFIVQTRFKKNIRVAIIVSQLQTQNGVSIHTVCKLQALAGLLYNCIMTGYLVYKQDSRSWLSCIQTIFLTFLIHIFLVYV